VLGTIYGVDRLPTLGSISCFAGSSDDAYVTAQQDSDYSSLSRWSAGVRKLGIRSPSSVEERRSC